ncbi:hypothetical protein DW732_02755 [Collinsella sp. AM28-11LB]|nr:hypothetical protein DW732_02755 [Collinsella sp. AM28-11LB]
MQESLKIWGRYRVINALKKDGLGKNIAIMGLGTLLAQGINVLIQPLLSRIFPASDLGIYTFVISVANILIPIASLKLDLLIVSEKDDMRAQYITDICVLACFFVAFGLFFFLIVCKIFFPNVVLLQYGSLIYFAPILVLTNGLRFLFISYNNRYKEYKLISKLEALRELVRAAIQTASGFLIFGAQGLLAGYAVAPVLGYRLQMKRYFQGLKNRPRITFSQIKGLLIRGRKQIMFIMPAQLINSFSSSLVTMMIGALFSASALGYYSMGVRVLDVPIMFISSNVSKVCFQRICESVSESQPISKTIAKLVLILSAVSIATFGVVFLAAVPLCELIFGQGYGIAGSYIRCLCLMYAMRLVATSFSGSFTAFGKQKYELFLNVALVLAAFIVYGLSIACSWPMESFLKAIGFGYSIMYACMLAGVLCCCFKFDRQLKSL